MLTEIDFDKISNYLCRESLNKDFHTNVSKIIYNYNKFEFNIYNKDVINVKNNIIKSKKIEKEYLYETITTDMGWNLKNRIDYSFSLKISNKKMNNHIFIGLVENIDNLIEDTNMDIRDNILCGYTLSYTSHGYIEEKKRGNNFMKTLQDNKPFFENDIITCKYNSKKNEIIFLRNNIVQFKKLMNKKKLYPAICFLRIGDVNKVELM